MSLFISFEGGEGCGKSVQSRALFRRLNRDGMPTILTHEPGGTRLGERLTRLLKWDKQTEVTPLTEVMLFNASRTQLVSKVILPALQEEVNVICDRFVDSTIAYQGYGRGLDIKLIKQINEMATRGLKPDVTFLLDVPVEIGFARKTKQMDRFENESQKFHQLVRGGFLKMAAEDPLRWQIIDGTQSVNSIKNIIWQKIKLLLEDQLEQKQ